ncbi:MAG: ABC transporter permease [Clostridiales bacterium]|nr:ABC transporter permease [Clostridiales bacterium]
MKSVKRNQGKLHTLFSQFFHVLSFTVMQTIKGKKYLKLTIGIMFLLLAVTFSGSIIFVYTQHENKEEKNTSIKKVWILEGTLEKDFLKSEENIDKTYQDIRVKTVSNMEEISSEQIGENDILIQVEEKEESYYIQGVIAKESKISKEDAGDFLDVVKESFYNKLVKESGISQINLELLKKDKVGNVYEIGDSEFGIKWIITVGVVMFVEVIIYLLIAMYGQSIMMEVSSEKTSKLMETMLVDVYPEALVSGKILGIAFLGILQVLLWIGGLIYGFVTGVLLGSVLFPEESSSYGMVMETTRSYGIDINLTSGLLMAILVIGLGILVYCFLSGIPGSLIAKPEHAGNVQQLIQMPLMVCYVAVYYAIFAEEKELLGFFRYFPFTAPFVLPGELLVGTSSVGTGWIVSGILLVIVVFLGILSGKIYKYKALNNGK